MLPRTGMGGDIITRKTFSHQVSIRLGRTPTSRTFYLKQHSGKDDFVQHRPRRQVQVQTLCLHNAEESGFEQLERLTDWQARLGRQNYSDTP